MDIDEYDTMEDAYRQLIVWSPEDEQILGGYRFLCGSDVKFDENGKPILATSHLLISQRNLSRRSLPYTVELGTLVRGSGVSIHPFRGERLVRVG